MFRPLRLLPAALLAVALAGCDVQRIEKLEEGVATEADVKREFGEPAAVYTEDGGARTFEYPRQPEGRRNYMITIGPDGKMSALRQVLTPANFAKVAPGMDRAQVRRLLGKPARAQVYERQREEVWDWRFVDAGQNKTFSVTFDAGGVVTGQGIGPDPSDTQTGG